MRAQKFWGRDETAAYVCYVRRFDGVGARVRYEMCGLPARSRSSNHWKGTDMQNLEVIVRDDGKVAIVFNPKVRLGPSASGKTIIVSSTGGNQTIQTPAGPVTVGFNAYVKKP